MDDTSSGDRLAGIRRRRGMSQKDLARLSDVSVATIRNMEQGTGTRPRVQTLLKLAASLKVDTTTLMYPGQPEAPDPAPVEQWDDVRDALYEELPAAAGEPATEAGILAALAGCIPDIGVNRYSRARLMLPGLIRDARSLGREGRAAQATVYNTAAWLLTQTRQFSDAEAAARLALDAAPDHLHAASPAATWAWCLLRQGRLAEAAALAERWADDLEPTRVSRATPQHLAAWGKLLLFVNNAAVRDNRCGAAEDALSLAGMAAERIGREVRVDASTARTFGPGTVLMIRGENEVLTGNPQRALDIAERVPWDGLLYRGSANKRRHRLDVASAHVMLRQRDEAIGELSSLREQAPEWLAQQRTARDVLESLIGQWKRTIPAQVRELADAVQLPL
jgi:transcriptional regulator with XRE-family HTH domain